AAGLGCGEVIAATGKPRGCWIVVVPRDNHEVDGTVRLGNGNATQGLLTSSPLSATNWAKRIDVPLEFQPLESVCPIGAAERKTAGNESVAEAVSRWQPVLCQQAEAIFGYSQIADGITRRQLVSSDPQLGFVGVPVPADQVPAAQPLV